MSEAQSMRALVTGGAGFIGSSLCSALIAKGYQVIALDNLSSGSMSNLKHLIGKDGFEFVKGDCKNRADAKMALRNVDVVFHLAGRPDVRLRRGSPWNCFTENVLATEVLLEAARSAKAGRFVFTSSSTVYGEAAVLPTTEDYTPLLPISLYGASKLASEALLSGHSNSFGFDVAIIRLANIVGERSTRGIVHDFVEKLKREPLELEIFGDGTQRKSYLYIEDCVRAIVKAGEASSGIRTYNVGSEDQASVMEISEAVLRAMQMSPHLKLTGGVDGGRGWKGDVKSMLLDVSRMKELGWTPRLNSLQAIEETLHAMRRSGKLSAPRIG
jgi:UDP-glucose 4-epimerase